MGKLIVQGNEKPRTRQESGRDFGDRKRKAFIKALTESCNAKYAAEQAGVAVSTVYRRRAADATFRAEWEQAIGIGYSQLEMMMLERALQGVEKPLPAKMGDGVMRHYDDRTALALLKQHREVAVAAASKARVDRAEYEEACERILARLAKLKERLDGSVETKASGDGHAAIRWALQLVARRGG